MKKGTIVITLDQDAVKDIVGAWLKGNQLLAERVIASVESKGYGGREFEVTLEPDADFAKVEPAPEPAPPVAPERAEA